MILCFTVVTQFRKYKDNRYIEGKGISPDIYVKSGDNAYNVAMKYLDKIVKDFQNHKGRATEG